MASLQPLDCLVQVQGREGALATAFTQPLTSTTRLHVTGPFVLGFWVFFSRAWESNPGCCAHEIGAHHRAQSPALTHCSDSPKTCWFLNNLSLLSPSVSGQMPTLHFPLQGYSYEFIYLLFAFYFCMHMCIKACGWQPEDSLWESVVSCGSQVYQSWHQTPVPTESFYHFQLLLFSLFSFLRAQVTTIVLTGD